MKKTISIVITAVIVFAIWQFVSALFESNKLYGLMRDVADNAKNHSESQIKANFLSIAANDFNLQDDDVSVRVSYTQKRGVAGELTGKHGIQTTNKKILMDCRFQYNVLGIPLEKRLHLEQNYTMRAQMQLERNYEGF